MPRRTEEEPDLLPLLWEAGHALQAMSRHMERHMGISGPQRLVLREVARRPDIQPGELATLIGVHPSTVTGLVDRLVERGLLLREQREDDRRSSRLRVTDVGQRLLVARGVTVERVVQKAAGEMSPALRKSGAKFLRAVSLALREAAEDDSL